MKIHEKALQSARSGYEPRQRVEARNASVGSGECDATRSASGGGATPLGDVVQLVHDRVQLRGQRAGGGLVGGLVDQFAKSTVTTRDRRLVEATAIVACRPICDRLARMPTSHHTPGLDLNTLSAFRRQTPTTSASGKVAGRTTRAAAIRPNR